MRDFLEPEGRRVAWLLTEIERQSESRISTESRQELIQEVACHLDAAIRARLELGMAPIEAEKEAVELFGHPKTYVDELLRVHETVPKTKTTVRDWFKGDPKTMRVFYATVVWISVWLLTRGFEGPIVILYGGVWLLAIAFAYHSFRARVLRPLAIVSATMVCYVPLILGMTMFWTTFWDIDYPYAVPNWQATQYVADANSLRSQILEPLAELRHAVAIHARTYTPTEIQALSVADRELLYSEPTYPWGQDSGMQKGQVSIDFPLVRHKPTNDLKLATREWHEVAQQRIGTFEMSLERCNTIINGVASAQQSSKLSQFWPNLTYYVRILPAWLFPVLMLHLFSALLGRFCALPVWRRLLRWT